MYDLGRELVGKLNMWWSLLKPRSCVVGHLFDEFFNLIRNSFSEEREWMRGVRMLYAPGECGVQLPWSCPWFVDH